MRFTSIPHIALPYQAQGLNCDQYPFQVLLAGQPSVRTRTIVVASGARYRKLEVPDEGRFEGAGIYYAATAMEGELVKGEEVVVVGGGNSAGQAAVFLSRYAKHVHILVRSEGLAANMSDYLIQRITASPQITLHPCTGVVGLAGEHYLEQITWTNYRTSQTQTRPIRHIFLMIGAQPNTKWLEGCLKLDDKGFIMTGPHVFNQAEWSLERPPMMHETSIPGVFAAGDVRSGSIKRVASAVGEGAMVVSQIHQALATL